MSSDKNQNNESIIPSENRGLARYSSKLIGRGLDLAKALEQSKVAVKADRQGNQVKVDGAKFQTQIWKCIRTLTGHADQVTSVAITPDGKTLVSGDDDGIIKLWHLQTGKLLHTLTVDSTRCLYRKVVISPDGQTLACLTDHTVKIYCLETADLFLTLIHSDENDDFDEVFFSPDSQTIATSATIDEPTLQIWNLRTRKLLRTYQGFPFAISPDWQRFTKPGWDDWGDTIEMLNLQTGEPLSTISGGHSISVEFAFSPDGKTFASGGWDYDRDLDTKDHTVKVWDLLTGELLHTLTHSAGVDCVAFSPDGRTLLSVYGNFGENKTIKIWSLLTGEFINTPNSYSFTPDFTFSPDGQNLVVPYLQEIKIYHLSTGKLRCLITLENSDSVGRVAFSPDGQTLAVGCFNDTVMIWQLSPVKTTNAED